MLNFIRLHGVISQSIPQDVIRKETEKLNDFLKYKSMEDTLVYLTIYINHLSLLENQDKDAVLTYLIGLLGSGNRLVLMDIRRMNLYTIGKLIDDEKKINSLRKTIIQRLFSENTDGDDLFLSILEGVFVNLPEEAIKNIKDKISVYQTEKSAQWLERMNHFCPF